MQVTSLIVSSILLLSSINSGERVYQRLDKKYHKNKNKCEILAKKMISKKRKQPEPYYFMSLINYDNYKAAKSSKEEYTFFSRSLSYARKLQRLKPVDMAGEENWKKLEGALKKELPIIAERLRKAKLDSKAEMLLSKGVRMRLYVKSSLSPKSTAKVELKSYFSNGQYFGMPTGRENVQSASISEEKQLVAILNIARKEKGMAELVWDEDLARAARYHSFDMATQKYFDHASKDSIDGKLVEVGGTFKRIRKFYSKGFVNSENIAAGSSTSQRTYNQWFHSPGHYKNMFNSSSRKVGIGLYYDAKSPYKYYWSFCTALK